MVDLDQSDRHQDWATLPPSDLEVVLCYTWFTYSGRRRDWMALSREPGIAGGDDGVVNVLWWVVMLYVIHV